MLKKAFFSFCLVLLPMMSWCDWPQFRGPNNDGWSTNQTEGSLPIEFNENTNITWKIPIHDKGWCTPVIMDDQIWLTTATEDGHKMYVLCIDRKSGKILFDHLLFEIESPRPLGNDVNTYASPSSIIEDGRVYVHFGSYGTACINTETFETIWQRQDMPCNHFRGPASSPILFKDKLILTFDGADLQYQIALNKNTGETIWKTDRNSNFQDLDHEGKPKHEGDFRKAYSTPIIAMIDEQPRMVISSSYNAFCYDPRDGKEIWRIDHNCYSNATMALFGHGLFYIFTGRSRPELLAVQPGGKENIGDTHVKWRYDRGLPTMVSALLIDDLIYCINNGGVATCVDALTGELVWNDRLEGQYYASPVYAGGNIYAPNIYGDVTVIKPGRTCEILKVNKLEDGFMASPAVCDDEFYLRSKTHLYRIEKK